MTLAERVQTIRVRLKAATPGPWEISVVTPQHNDIAVVRGIQIRGPYKAVACKDDAALIAHAPTDLAFLCDQVERLLAVAEAADKLPPKWSVYRLPYPTYQHKFGLLGHNGKILKEFDALEQLPEMVKDTLARLDQEQP